MGVFPNQQQYQRKPFLLLSVTPPSFSTTAVKEEDGTFPELSWQSKEERKEGKILEEGGKCCWEEGSNPSELGMRSVVGRGRGKEAL